MRSGLPERSVAKLRIWVKRYLPGFQVVDQLVRPPSIKRHIGLLR